MLEALDQGWRHAPGLKPVTTEARDLYRRPLLADEMARYDSALLDPPRARAEAQIAQIASARLPRIAYISCNPVTFARDAAHLLSRLRDRRGSGRRSVPLVRPCRAYRGFHPEICVKSA